MMFFEWSGAPHVHAADVGSLETAGRVSQRGRAEPRDGRLLSDSGDFTRVFERARERFVDEERLARRDDFASLREMDAAIDAGQQHAIDALAKFGDGVDDLDAEFLLQGSREAVDAVPARGQVGTPALVSRDN